ncbi:glycoside hydrolase family 10 protein [Porphyromonas sp. COT-290 OH860]|uniref:glycoside hydrolase family 10 protein n=1 Tax=Porphyromonas sp. COT-290 OH860 TaxID=1515615 RepID=UPI00052E1313|nr:family 10 glycosylhydrolase [Porphyromonas sp. COT-290 OH860]KGN86594.1 hypothetical protein HQ41_00925 [Porphyromonas sp. COT-290 OH860]
MKIIQLCIYSLLLALLAVGCGTKKKRILEADTPEVPTPPVSSVRAPEAWKPPMGDSIRYEMRAVWLTTAYGLDWPSVKADTPNGIRRQQQELDRILDRLKQDGYNTVFFQARLSGSVIYPSKTEPFAHRLFTTTGQPPAYDPLAYAVEACHRRGLAIHAWLVTYPIVSSRKSAHPILIKNPSWAIAHKGSRHLDPGNPAVRTYIAKLAEEVVRGYNVDGIHFDYFRYPEEAERFNDNASYARYGKGLSREDWRRQNLSEQLVEINEVVRKIRPEIQISVAPLGKLRKLPTLARPHGWTAYESVFQDVEAWANARLVDFVAPMMYYKDDLYEPFLVDWMERVGKKIPVIAGLAPYRISESGWSAQTIADQIRLARRYGAGGVSMFREANIGHKEPLMRTLIQHEFRHLALPLPLYGRAMPRAGEPTDLTIEQDKNIIRLSWRMPIGSTKATYRVWAKITHPDGRTEGIMLVQGLKEQSCALRISEFPSEDCIELGVEAVNTAGVATACRMPVEFNLANARLTQVQMR